MRKSIILQLAVLIFVLVIALSIASTHQNISVTQINQAVNNENASTSIVFNLKVGQNVAGSLTTTGDTNGAWFQIYDSNGNYPKKGQLNYENSTVTFSFTSDINGKYFVYLPDLAWWGYRISYSYTISPPPILGLDPLFWIALVIAIGVVLELFVTFRVRYQSKKISL